MKQLIIISLLFICWLIPAIAHPNVQCTYMCKVLHVCNANTLIIENLYTRQMETLVIAGTQISNNAYINMIAMQYIDTWCLHDDYMAAISYGHDHYGRVVGDLKHTDRIQQLSSELIVQGYCYWYSQFNPNDTILAGCSHWAKQHHSGVYRYIKSNR